MQPFDTNSADPDQPLNFSRALNAGRVEDLPHGNSKTVQLPESRQLALFNVNGEFYAIDNFCPHQGAPLAEGTLCEHVVECERHGWQFDVRTVECLTVPEKLETYEVYVENGVIRIVI